MNRWKQQLTGLILLILVLSGAFYAGYWYRGKEAEQAQSEFTDSISHFKARIEKIGAKDSIIARQRRENSYLLKQISEVSKKTAITRTKIKTNEKVLLDLSDDSLLIRARADGYRVRAVAN